MRRCGAHGFSTPDGARRAGGTAAVRRSVDADTVVIDARRLIHGGRLQSRKAGDFLRSCFGPGGPALRALFPARITTRHLGHDLRRPAALLVYRSTAAAGARRRGRRAVLARYGQGNGKGLWRGSEHPAQHGARDDAGAALAYSGRCDTRLAAGRTFLALRPSWFALRHGPLSP